MSLVPEPHLQISVTRLITDEKGNAPVEVDVRTRDGSSHARYKDINAAMRVVHRTLRNFKNDLPLGATLSASLRRVASNIMGDGTLS